jgi:hypothetical protein
VAALGSAFTGEINTCEVESYLLSTSDPLFEAGRGAHATPQQQQQQQQQQQHSGATLQSPKVIYSVATTIRVTFEQTELAALRLRPGLIPRADTGKQYISLKEGSA